MSTTVDQRVAELRFDNAHFEKNVAESLSTLDKLKQKLNLTGASKGLEDVGRAAKNVNMDSLGRSAETVGLKFNAMYTIADQTLRNITNKVEQTATRMVKALTLDPITTGFQEYETQINAVQTILANTESKGSTIDDVNAALRELNDYADMTIYNFTEMTRNIGTFTAAGVDLETSTNAIKGIANLAAVSGSTSQQASTAMYQLSQALASGTVKLMDWNSVVNAGMGGQVFQDALKETARVHGIAIDSMIEEQGSFRETLSEGWLTSEILTETLQKFTLATEGLTEAEIEQNREMLRAKGYTEDQIEEIFKLGNTATNAATKVKTFTQLWDVLKEAAQSGWSQTWQLIVGDFEQAKALLTPLSEFLTGIIGKMSDWRNAVLTSALAESFTDIGERIKKLFDPITKTADNVKGVVDTLKDYDKVVDEIIAGKWDNGQTRWDALTEAGYDWAHAQNLVNEKLGDSTRHATNYKEAQGEAVEATGELTESNKDYLKELVKLDDEQLKAKNLNEEQIAAIKELKSLAEQLGIPIEDLIDNLDNLNGRFLLINSFKNIGKALIKVFNSMKEAWQEVFPPKTTEEYGNMLLNLITGFSRFTSKLIMSEETADKFKRTLRGVFSVFDILLKVVGGPIKIAFKVLTQLLGAFDLNILDITAVIGDAIYKFNQWLDSSLDFTAIFKKLVPYVQKGYKAIKTWFGAIRKSEEMKKFADALSRAGGAIKDWIVGLKDSELVKKFVTYIKDGAKAVKDWFGGFGDTSGFQKMLEYLTTFINKIGDIFTALSNKDYDLAGDIVSGLVEGLRGGVSKVWNAAIEIGKSVLESIKDFLGIHSPSTKFIEVGGNIIDGLVQGIQNGFSAVLDTMKSLGQKCLEVISNIDFSKVFALVASGALIMLIKKIGDAIEAFSGPLEGISDILENTADAIKAFKGTLKAFSANIKAKAIKNIAIALAILVGSVIALTFFDPKELWNAVGVVAALAVVLGILAVAADKMSKSSITIGKDGLTKAGFNAGIISIGVSLLLLAATVKMIGNLNPEQAKQGFLGLAALVVAVGVVFAAYGKLVKGKAAMNIDKAGIMMTKMAGALLIMAIVAKLVAGMEWSEMGKAGAFIGGFVVLVALLATIGMIPSKNIKNIGPMMTKIAGALLLMVIVAKIIADMEWADMKKAAVGIGGLVAIIAVLTLITRLAGGRLLGDIGDTLMKIAGAMIILTFVAKIVAGMSWDDMGKAAVGLLGLAGVIAILVAIVKSVEKDAPKIAATLLAMSVAMGILAGVAIILSLIDLPGLVKGVVAMGLLGGVMALMIASTKNATDVKGTIMSMAIAIGVMAAAAAILSLIDSKKLAVSTAALSAMMLSFAQIAKQASGLKGSMGSLIVMTVVVGLLGGMVYLLAKLPVESVTGTAVALSTLLVSLAAAMNIIGTAGPISTKALIAVGVMTLVTSALGGILYLLKDLPVQSTLVNALALSTLLLALSAAVVILNGASMISPMALVAAGVMTAIMAVLAVILYKLKDLPVQSTMANVLALSTLLLALSGACVLLEVAGLAGPAALWGVAALSALIIAVGGLMTGIGALVTKFPQLEEFLNKGIPILEKIGHGLGSFFGNIISGFAEGLTDSLPSVATNLSNFMTNLQPFIDGAKTIDETALNGISSLVKMVALVGGASIIESISSFISGGSSMDTFSAQIVKFGDAIVAFSNKVKGNIDESSVLAAANAGKLLAEMQSMTAGTGGVVQWFTGEKNLETFGTQLLAFGDAIIGFSKKVAGNIDEGAVTAAANAGTLMTELQSKVAPTGGVVQWFTGEKDMATFGTQLTAFGEAIVGFSKSLKDGINEEAVTAAATAGSIMTELQSKITPTGGVVQWFTGEKNLETFGTQLKAFGEAMVAFSKEVSGNIDEGAVTAAANAGEMMVALQKSIPEDKWFDGKVSLDDFGKTIKNFGGHIKGYSEKVSGIDTEAINASVSATKQIVSITRSLGSVNPDNIENFKAKALGKAVKSYSDNVSDIHSGAISSSISAIKKLIGVINSMAGLDTSGVGDFKKAVSSLAKTNLDGIVESFSNSASKLSKVGSNIIDSISKGMLMRQASLHGTVNKILTMLQTQIRSRDAIFQQSGLTLVTRFAQGLTSGRSKAVSAIRTPMAGALTSIRGYYNNFYSAGSYLVTGFASGISANTWRAEAKARAMANAAEKAAKEALDINSPSKVFRALGYSVPEGFAVGIDKLSYMASGSASDMATTAVGGVKDAISRISDYMNADIDSQPTIRPVLDLSDVKSGASAINGMFNSTQSIGVMSNVRAISSMMSNRQNGADNDDIISALKDLGRNLSGNTGNTYNVNGVSYNAESEVADAIQTIARYALIERRV